MAFCRLPWQGIQITPLGDFRMCALTNDRFMNMSASLDEQGKVMNIMTHSPKDGLNGKWHRSVRVKDVKDNGAWHPICSCCKEREEATGSDAQHANASRRQSMERRNPSTNPVDPANYTAVPMDANGYVDYNPTTLDIRFGNLCNQKCIQCGPHNSNQWYDDWAGFYNTESVPWGFGKRTATLIRNEHGRLHNPDEVRWWETDTWWSKFEELIPTLEHIYLTGGEPMIVPAHDEMLDRLIASGRAKDIYLDYDTNLSVINDRLAERWQHFKHVEIAVSMDAAYDAYELIRSGGRWETFNNNIKRIKEYEKNGVVRLHRVTACTQLSTLYTMFDTEDWALEHNIPFQIRFVDAPKMHGIMYLPASAKLELIEYYSRRNSDCANTIKNYLVNHLDPKYEYIPAMKEYLRFMDYLDTTRNTNWRKTLVQTADLLNKYIK